MKGVVLHFLEFRDFSFYNFSLTVSRFMFALVHSSLQPVFVDFIRTRFQNYSTKLNNINLIKLYESIYRTCFDLKLHGLWYKKEFTTPFTEIHTALIR